MNENNNPIKDIEEQLKALQKKKSDLIKTNKYMTQSKYRKERARRLIETGALAEKYFSLNNLSIEEREELFKMFSEFVIANTPKKFKKN